jgi:hypothetical protein
MSVFHHSSRLPLGGNTLSDAPNTDTNEEQPAEKLRRIARDHGKMLAKLGGGAAAAAAIVVLAPHSTEAINGTASPEPGYSAAPKPGVAPGNANTSQAPTAEKGLMPADKNLCNLASFSDLNNWLGLGIPKSMVNDIHVDCNDVPTRRGFMGYGEWHPDPSSAASMYDSIVVTIDADAAVDGRSNYQSMVSENPKHIKTSIGMRNTVFDATDFPEQHMLAVKVPNAKGDRLVTITVNPQEGFGSSHEVQDALFKSELGGAVDMIPKFLPGADSAP